jgi:hypothetical protein
MHKMVHHQQCAAITNGCMSALVWESDVTFVDSYAERFLTLNGWWVDHGKWVCGLHERPPSLAQ